MNRFIKALLTIFTIAASCALMAGSSYAQYGSDTSFPERKLYDKDCAPDTPVPSWNGEFDPSGLFSKCGIRLRVVANDGRIFEYVTWPSLQAEDKARNASWKVIEQVDATAHRIDAEGIYWGTDNKLYSTNVTNSAPLLPEQVGSLPSIAAWWSHNDEETFNRTIFVRTQGGKLAMRDAHFSSKQALSFINVVELMLDLKLGVTQYVNEGKVQAFTAVDKIDLIGAPAAVPHSKQPLVSVFIRSPNNELEEWTYDTSDWYGPVVRASNLASAPRAMSQSFTKSIVNSRAKQVSKFSCKGKFPGRKSFGDLTIPGCWTCNGGARTIHHIKSAKACAPPRQWSAVAGRHNATGLFRTDCRSGYFLHGLSGVCYRCPSGYARSVEGVNGRRACFRDRNWSSATKLGDHGCPSGSFRNGLTDICYVCPGGGHRTVFAGNQLDQMDNACETWRDTLMIVRWIGTDGSIHEGWVKPDQSWEERTYPRGPAHLPFTAGPFMFGVNEGGQLLILENRGKDNQRWTSFHKQPPTRLAGSGVGTWNKTR